jgi:multidrug efflux pump subunit AcrA (membrane-fusion protein)
LRPDDQVLIAEGIHVVAGQPIALRDVSKQLKTLELQLAEERARLQADLEQIGLQINAMEQEMESREIERDELERRLRAVRDQALLSKEAGKIEGALIEQKKHLEELAGRRSLLVTRRMEILERLQAVARQAVERRHIIAREAEIKAGFAGKIVRIMREAAASEVTLRISYETLPPDQEPTLTPNSLD